METCGYADHAIVTSLAPFVDLFLYDIKTLDNGKHLEGTGKGNGIILENAAWLARSGKSLTLRMPLVPGYNDSEQEVKNLLAFAIEIGLSSDDVKLLRYNPLGEVKYDRLGRELEKEKLNLKPQSDEYFDYLASLLQ